MKREWVAVVSVITLVAALTLGTAFGTKPPWAGGPHKTTTTSVSTTSTSTSTTTTTTPGSCTQTAYRAAFLYPWFPQSWTQNGVYPYTNYHPTLGYYSSSDPTVIDQQFALMKQAKLDLFISSWWGPGHNTDTALQPVLDGAARAGKKVAIYYEDEAALDPSVSTIVSDLTYLNKYFTQDSYLKVNGKPVVFVYGSGTDGQPMAQRWADAKAQFGPLYDVLKVFSGYKTITPQPDSWHQYGPAANYDSQLPYSVSVSPGFWKYGEAPRLVRDLNRFQTDIANMASSGAFWQLVTTWNEWGEGTSVEPATEFGTDYINALAALPSTCTGGGTTTTTTVPTTTTVVTTTTVQPTTTTTIPTTSPVCGSTATPPAQYDHIVVIMNENRTWSGVGGVGFGSMPYLHSLATACTHYQDWTETNTSQNSLTQYIGLTTGVNNTSTVNDCSPSTTCRSTDNNIFRQVRTSGGTTRSYVEGATTGCSAGGNAAKHIPALYMFGTYTDATGTHNDHDFCSTEVRPLTEFNVNGLPTFAMITPNLCNDGHDCGNATVDNWDKAFIQNILNSATYKAGRTAVMVYYDEDYPVPNLLVAPTAHVGMIATTTQKATHAAALRTWEELLGVPVMQQGQLLTAPSLRPTAHI